MGAIDIVLFNDIQNVMQMYSISGDINPRHQLLAAWSARMLTNDVIKDRHNEMLAILKTKDLKKDFIK